MGVYDYIIIGGGVSGLFMAYKLADTNKDILVLESTNRWGGRLLTVKEKGVQFEMGAARISSKHHKVMSLLKELDLKDGLLELPDDINYKVSGVKIKYESLVKELLEKSKMYTKSYLQSITLFQLAIDTLGYKMAVKFKGLLGYDSEFEFLNAYSVLKTYNKDLFSSSDYYILTQGISSITDTIVKRLSDKQNVTLKTDTLVTDIGKNFVQIDKKKIYCSKIISCVPYKSVASFPRFSSCPEIHSVEPIPLIRIYAKYPKDKSGKVWFHNLKRTITDNYIRHIIPIDYEKGLIMISYTDGMLAKMWRNLSKVSNKVLVEHLHKEVNEVLHLTPPKPEMITSYYWDAGVHMWNAGINVKEIQQKLMKPFDDYPIYLVNEAFAKHQCWIEGCLESSYDVLAMVEPKFTRTKPKKVAKGGAKRVKKSKIYTLDQVLKKRNWIVLDIKKQLRIFDVGGWLKDHPGGRDNLKRGIAANKYYKDPVKYPDPPIKLFKQIGAHSSSKVLKRMLLTMENPKVKYVGVMKKV